MQEIYPARNKQRRRAFAFVGIELLILLLITIPIVLVLNYFRVMYLPFLPQRPLISVPRQNEIVSYATQPVLFICPLASDLCVEGKKVFNVKKRAFVGIGYPSLVKGVEILAVHAGTVDIQNVGNLVTISLVDEKNEHVAKYIFSGSATSGMSATVGQGDVIGLTDGSSIAIDEDGVKKWSLYIEVSDVVTGQILPLKPSADGKSLGFN